MVEKTFAAAVREFFPDAKAAELAEFIKACSPEDREQFAKELSMILGVTVTITRPVAK